MIVPEKSQLPLLGPNATFELTSDSFRLFEEAFQCLGDGRIPWTYGARALTGIFKILDDLQIDWKNLLHASQSFTAIQPLVKGQRVRVESKLFDCRVRANTAWLQFQADLFDQDHNVHLQESRSLILIQLEASKPSVPAVTAEDRPILAQKNLGQVTRTQIVAYANASGDFNRIHLDDEFARSAGLRSVIAHGMLTMGLAANALRSFGYEFEPSRKLEAKFKEVVYPDDTLEIQVLEKSEKSVRARVINHNRIEVLALSL